MQEASRVVMPTSPNERTKREQQLQAAGALLPNEQLLTFTNTTTVVTVPYRDVRLVTIGVTDRRLVITSPAKGRSAQGRHEIHASVFMVDRDVERVVATIREQASTECHQNGLRTTSDSPDPTVVKLLPGEQLLDFVTGDVVSRRLMRKSPRVRSVTVAVTGSCLHIFSKFPNYQVPQSFFLQVPVTSVDVHRGLDATLTALLQARSIKVERDYAPLLPPLRGRDAHLRELWGELINSAIPYGRLGLRTADDGGRTVVEVDGGPGMPDDDAALKYAQLIAERHGGTVTRYSRPGYTTSRVLLPALPERELSAEPIPES